MSDDYIKISNLSKSYGDFVALKNVSLNVKRGERVVICGPSGSGKSTLIRCINQLEIHESGEIHIDGQLQGPRSEGDLSRSVGMVFQQFNLFPHLRVIENLTLGLRRVLGLSKEAAQERAKTYLARVKILEQAEKYPRQLSGGQQQRVAIARSLCMEPKILLFDEPTSALDPEMIAEVLEVMTEVAMSGMTVLVVTHEMGFARRVADRMVFMDQGEIVEIGKTEAVFDAPKSPRFAQFLQQIINH